MKLRVSSAATTSSSAVIAIWPATSASRSVQRRPAACDAGRLAAQIGDQARFRRLQCRRQAGEQRGKERRAERERQDAAVDPQIEGERNRHRQAERRDGRRDPPRQQHAGGGAEQRQHHRLGDELPHQTAAAGADRQADADFLLPARRARQQHAGDVRAGNQQHETDDRSSAPRRSAPPPDRATDESARRWSA